MRWIQDKRSTNKLKSEDKENLLRIQNEIDIIPPKLIASCAVDCNEYARALFHLEQHAQKIEQQKRLPGERTALLQELQDIYANIDEPDGLEGISAHLPALDIKQQILSHKKAGRWTAAQTWYEMQLAEKPDNFDVQSDLLHCLKQAGQHGKYRKSLSPMRCQLTTAVDVLLNHVEGMQMNISNVNKIMPFAVEAAWVTGRWESLAKFTRRFNGSMTQDFNISVASVFESLRNQCTPEQFTEAIQDIRESISSSMSASATASLQAAHEQLLKCHVLTDMEIIVGTDTRSEVEHRKTKELLDGRLEVMGAYFNDKQYILGIRRATMELTRSVAVYVHIPFTDNS